MRGGNVPVGDLAGFVYMRAEVGDDVGLAECVGKVQVGGGRVDRIGVEDYEPVDLAGVEIGDERLEVGKLVARQRIHGLGRDGDRFAHIAECVVDGQRELRDRLILIEARNHGGLAGVCFQVLCEGG